MLCDYKQHLLNYQVVCTNILQNSFTLVLKHKIHIQCTFHLFNPLTPNIKEQILVSCPNTFLIKVQGRSY